MIRSSCKKKRVFPAFVALALGVLPISPCLGDQLSPVTGVGIVPRNLEPGTVDTLGSLGNFRLEDAFGNAISLSTFDNKKVVLYFWSMHCRTCVDTLRRLTEEREQFSKNDVVVLAVHLFEANKEEVVVFNQTNQFPLPLYFAPNEIRAAYQIHQVPEFFLFDEEHRLKARKSGDTKSAGLLEALL